VDSGKTILNGKKIDKFTSVRITAKWPEKFIGGLLIKGGKQFF